MLDLEPEENWLRHRLRRLRTILRYANEPRVESGLRELIADAEERLDLLERLFELRRGKIYYWCDSSCGWRTSSEDWLRTFCKPRGYVSLRVRLGGFARSDLQKSVVEEQADSLRLLIVVGGHGAFNSPNGAPRTDWHRLHFHRRPPGQSNGPRQPIASSYDRRISTWHGVRA
jgi:hypothetical protein